MREWKLRRNIMEQRLVAESSALWPARRSVHQAIGAGRLAAARGLPLEPRLGLRGPGRRRLRSAGRDPGAGSISQIPVPGLLADARSLAPPDSPLGAPTDSLTLVVLPSGGVGPDQIGRASCRERV